MENAVQIFKNDEFGQVRTVVVGNEPMFVGKDIANILGYQNGSRDINAHVDDEDKLKYQIGTAGQNREMTVINESGLYALVFGSKLPTAKKFKRWVTHDVLPAIRKTGSYAMPVNPPTVKYFAKMPVLTKMDLAKYFQCTRHDIHTALESARSGCIREKDYMVARGKVLSEFKKANPSVEKRCTSLVLIFKPGVNKLCQYFKKSFNNSTHQQTTLPIPTSKGAAPIPILPVRRVTQTRTDIPDNPKVQECIRRIQQQRSAMDELLRLYNRYNSPEGQKSLTYSLKSVATDLMASVLSMEDIPYNLVEKYV